MVAIRGRASAGQAMTGVARARSAVRSHAAITDRNSRAARSIGSRFEAASHSGTRAKITIARDMERESTPDGRMPFACAST